MITTLRLVTQSALLQKQRSVTLLNGLAGAGQVVEAARVQAIAASLSAVDAEAAKTAAELARDAAQAGANVYASTAAGLAAVADGVQFMVVSGNEIIRYTRTDAVTATEVARYPAAAAFTGLSSLFECAIIPSAAAPCLPNINTTAGTLEFINNTMLLARNTHYILAATSVSLTGVASSAKKVYYNTASPGFEVKAFNSALTDAEKLTHVLVATIRYVGTADTTHMAISCPYTVNGLAPGAKSAYRSTDFAAVICPLSAVTAETNYPNYADATKTFTLNRDTILCHGNSKWALPSAQSIVVGVSSANKVWWDTSTNALKTTIWNADLTDAQRAAWVLVAAIRQSGVVPTVLSMTCPWTVNGVLFGNTGVVPNPVGAAVEGILHRGYSGIAPENTLPAYRKAAEYKNSYIEGDIRWTSDDVPVLLHDSTVDRTSDGTGAISGMTLATAKTYDFGSWKGAAYTGTTIPAFEEVLKVMKKLSLHGYFEIKIDPTVGKIQQLLALVRKTGMKGRIQFDCFNLATLQAVVTEDPTQAVGHLGSLSSAFITSCVTLKTGQNQVTAAVDSATVTAALVEEAHLNGLRVVCWTVNTAADVPTLAALGVDGIMTDTLNVAALLRSSEGVLTA